MIRLLLRSNPQLDYCYGVIPKTMRRNSPHESLSRIIRRLEEAALENNPRRQKFPLSQVFCVPTHLRETQQEEIEHFFLNSNSHFCLSAIASFCIHIPPHASFPCPTSSLFFCSSPLQFPSLVTSSFFLNTHVHRSAHTNIDTVALCPLFAVESISDSSSGAAVLSW